MKVLFVGGSGNISSACTTRALEKGHDVYHCNRGTRPIPKEVTLVKCDIRNRSGAAAALKGMSFDVVADFLSYTPEHIETILSLFEGHTRQYIFISSASVYNKPPLHHVISESTPLHNPLWKYSSDKILCENMLMDAYRTRGFPVTIVRPAHTYDNGFIPLPFQSASFTIPKRILDGREMFVHGDGQSLWTITHSRDFAVGFVGLFANPNAIAQAYNINSDEVFTWDMIFKMIGDALGKKPNIIHIPSDFVASVNTELGAALLGDKAYSSVFDNYKIKQTVPEFRCVIPFHEGLRESVDWLLADPARQKLDEKLDKDIDEVIAAYKGR
ncbi:MAG: SDR family oxidoreductase [Spirochaetales bacterium]|nr:SDR family oxidoreductase [Spirochaetales bacterium]